MKTYLQIFKILAEKFLIVVCVYILASLSIIYVFGQQNQNMIFEKGVNYGLYVGIFLSTYLNNLIINCECGNSSNDAECCPANYV